MSDGSTSPLQGGLASLRAGDCAASGLRRILDHALSVTGAEYGFIGMLHPEPLLRIYAHQGFVWAAEEGRHVYDAAAVAYRERGYAEFDRFENLFGEVIRTGDVVVSHDCASDPRSRGLPLGHPRLDTFLGSPIFDGERLVGMFGLANRPGGFDRHSVEHVSSLNGLALLFFEGIAEEERQAAARAEQQRVQRTALVTALAAQVSDEFNNALLVIQGHAAQIRRRTVSEIERDASSRILSAVEEATGLVRQLLSLVGKIDSKDSSVDLVAVVRALEGALRSELGSGISLRLICEEGLRPVAGDAGLIGMSLVVMARNARDALAGRGNVEIQVRHASEAEIRASSFLDSVPEYGMIEFRDDGPGMSQDVVERIFDPFFSTKPFGTGRGIGLTAVQAALRDQRGWLSVDSVEGAGATFRLLLPVMSAPGGNQRSDRIGSRRPTVMLVDDREPALHMLAQACRTGGLDIQAFSSARDALAFASAAGNSIDVVVTDVVMPDMDGIELASRLREIRPGTEIIFITGYYESAVRLDEIGGKVISKPFDPEDLIRAVLEVIKL